MNNTIVAPSITAVNLTHKQIFPSRSETVTENGVTITPNGVSKNTIKFEREEDMIVLCLSAFVHDYVHDYNLEGMHARVIKGNVVSSDPTTPSLFQSLGITIGNTVFKIISYSIGGHRDINLYNDDQFEDETTKPGKKMNFETYQQKSESVIPTRGGTYIGGISQPNVKNNVDGLENSIEETSMTVDLNDKQKFPDISTNEQQDLEPGTKQSAEETALEPGTKQSAEEPALEPGAEEPVSVKSVNLTDVSDLLFKPISTTLTANKYDQIIGVLEKDANFLGFHSSLNTYIATYLGYDVNEYDTFNQTETDDKNVIMNKAILASFDYIINDFNNSTIEVTDNSIKYLFYSDIFKLLRLAYSGIYEKDPNKNPLDVLNSSEVLYQFIIFYVTYLTQKDYSEFELLVNSKKGGAGEEGEEGEGEEGEGEEGTQEVVEGIASSSSSQAVDDSSSPLLPKSLKQNVEVPEYVFITHNNLLTTISRGMFIKLGIWKKIFFPDTPTEQITPELYVFGFDEMNQITYDKLIEIYPIQGANGHKNNELLILEILILKRLLVEMSPSRTLTFGGKIDDHLKNYMDAFYYDYYIKNSALTAKPEVSLDNEVSDNPDVSPVDVTEQERVALEKEAEEFFEMCEDCGDEPSDGSAGSGIMEGGEGDKPTDEGIEMVPLKTETAIQEPSSITEEPVASISEEPVASISEEQVASVIQEQPVVSEEPVASISEEQVASVIQEQPVVSEEPVASISEEPVASVIQEQPVVLEEPVALAVASVEGTKDPNVDIIEQPRQTSMPLLFDKMKKTYQNNMYTIKQLQNSKIEPIQLDEQEEPVDNLYELLSLNQTLMHKKGTKFNLSAPKFKFVINNAANVGANINGYKMFYLNNFATAVTECLNDIKQTVYDGSDLNQAKLDTMLLSTSAELDKIKTELEDQYVTPISELNSKKRNGTITIIEYNKLLELAYKRKELERTQITPLENKIFLLEQLKTNPDFFNEFEQNYNKWFKDSQPVFGLYRNLQRGIFCPTSSMMDAMDNCSLKYNSSEPKEVGTSYSEIVYSNETGKKISFGGVVLNYNETVNGTDELTAKLYYDLVCEEGGEKDVMTISTLGIKVSESNDLKARVAYKSVIEKIKQIYDTVYTESTSNSSEETAGDQRGGTMEVIKTMWKNVQYQFDKLNFNNLLSSTALKTMGDYLQECQACFKWGGYVNNYDMFPQEVLNNRNFKGNENKQNGIKHKLIYRSVSKGGAVIPYDLKGNGLRLGIQGDRPSGFRSIYILLNGKDGINDQSITGYMFTSATQNPSRSLLVSRNKGEVNSNGLMGNVVYVTRELQTPDKNALLKSLEFLNVKDKAVKLNKVAVIPEVSGSTIEGTDSSNSAGLLQNPMGKVIPLKNSAYNNWLDYETEFVPSEASVEIENEMTDKEESRRKKSESKNKVNEAEILQRAAEKQRIKEEADSKKVLEKQQKDNVKAARTALKKNPNAEIAPEIREIIQREDEEKRLQLEEETRIKAETKTKTAASSAERKEKERIRLEIIKNYRETEEGKKIVTQIEELEEKIGQLISEIKSPGLTGSREENKSIIQNKKTEIGTLKNDLTTLEDMLITNALNANDQNANALNANDQNANDQNANDQNANDQNANALNANDLMGGNRNIRTNTKTNRPTIKPQLRKQTKKHNKEYNKLTRRQQKITKQPRKTRKYISQ